MLSRKLTEFWNTLGSKTKIGLILLKVGVLCIALSIALVMLGAEFLSFFSAPLPLQGHRQDGQDLVKRLLTRNEGRRSEPYQDSTGNTIVGVGHRVVGEAKSHYSDAEIDALLAIDIHTAETGAQQVVRNYGTLSEVRKAVIIDMVFQLGIGGFIEFQHFIDAVENGNKKEAATAMLNSLAARQSPVRWHRNAKAFRSNTATDFELEAPASQ